MASTCAETRWRWQSSRSRGGVFQVARKNTKSLYEGPLVVSEKQKETLRLSWHERGQSFRKWNKSSSQELDHIHTSFKSQQGVLKIDFIHRAVLDSHQSWDEGIERSRVPVAYINVLVPPLSAACVGAVHLFKSVSLTVDVLIFMKMWFLAWNLGPYAC